MKNLKGTGDLTFYEMCEDDRQDVFHCVMTGVNDRNRLYRTIIFYLS